MNTESDHLAAGVTSDVHGDTGRGASDRELLELAATATGIGPGWVEAFVSRSNAWNPLTDNGQALELAVKLRLQIHIEDYGSGARLREGAGWALVRNEGDSSAATRRAIVKAAANIARSALAAAKEPK